MNASSGLLRAGCRVTVALWMAAYLAWQAIHSPAQAVSAPEVEESVARVQPVVESEPEREPEPETAAEPEPAEPERVAEKPEPVEAEPKPSPEAVEPEPTPTLVGSAEIREGSRLLDGGGVFPVLTCSYEDFASFRDYARAMSDLGARFVVVRDRQIVGSVDLDSGRVGEASADRAYSPRARDYTGEPGLASIARTVRGRFGSGAVVMMLVPREVDAGLYGGIARVLAQRGDRHDRYREIRGRYERSPGGGVQLRVDTAVGIDGDNVDMGLLFDLSAIADTRAAGGGPSA